MSRVRHNSRRLTFICRRHHIIAKSEKCIQNSPGLRPDGVSDNPLRYYFKRLIGFFDDWPPPRDPRPTKCAPRRLPWVAGRPLGAFRMFGTFYTDQKNIIFAIAPNSGLVPNAIDPSAPLAAFLNISAAPRRPAERVRLEGTKLKSPEIQHGPPSPGLASCRPMGVDGSIEFLLFLSFRHQIQHHFL